MYGEFISVWSETWREIWLPLVEQPLNDDDRGVPEDVFCELYAVLAGSPKKPGALKNTPSLESLADVLDNPAQSREALKNTNSDEMANERVLVTFFETVHDALGEYGGDLLSNRYFNLLAAFIDKFSLRYDLRRPCVLCPTLPGVFASLVRDLRGLTSQDPHLDQLMKEYEDAVRDLRFGCSDGRIKTCIGKQFMLLEAIGAFDPGVTKNTLGDMCDQLQSWPHATIKQALQKLYGFASDYPGIRHGSRAKGVLRAIEMRDMVAMSILLTGFTPYLERRLSPDAIYGGYTISAAPANAIHVTSIAVSGSSGDKSQIRGLFGRLLDRVLGGKA